MSGGKGKRATGPETNSPHLFFLQRGGVRSGSSELLSQRLALSKGRRNTVAGKPIGTSVIAFFLGTVLAGCTSFGSLGFVMKSSADPTLILHSGATYEELGSVEGRACRFLALALVPWGNSNFQTAVDIALSEKGGDALVNVSESSSLYGFIPVYNFLSYTCTTVKGIAIKIQKPTLK